MDSSKTDNQVKKIALGAVAYRAEEMAAGVSEIDCPDEVLGEVQDEIMHIANRLRDEMNTLE
jgi:hypothetical protein